MKMRLKYAVAFAFAFVGVCCLVLSALSTNDAIRASETLRDVPVSAAAAVLQQDAPLRVHAEESVLSSAHSNARLRLLADYTRTTSVDANEVAETAATPAPSTPLGNSIPATVRPLPPTPAPRRSTPPPPPPPPPTPKLSESPVIRFQNLEPRASANLSVSDYVSNAFLASVYLGKVPSDVNFHFEAASHLYEVSGTVQFDGATLPVETIICTEFASIILSVAHQTRHAEIRCDPGHSQPDSVTVQNLTPEDAQITIVDGLTGNQLSQQILRTRALANIRGGNANSVFVTYARIAGVNWRPAGCQYRGTVTITGSRTADGGIKVNCDEQHRAKSTLRIINGSGECPVHATILTAEKGGSGGAQVPSKPLDDFSVNCGDTAESFIGHTDNSYRRITVNMADGSAPSIICPAGSTVLVGGSGLHC